MVSVILPSYNHAPFLRQRIHSIIEQTYTNFELIILDDCSTDNSRVIIEEYRDFEKVSHIVYNEYNSGSTFKQWNKGVSLAKGEWIWIAESDDNADPDFLTTLAQKIVGDDKLGLVYSQSYRYNDQDKIEGSWITQTESIDSEKFKSDFEMEGTDFIERYLVHKNVIPNASGVLFKKDIFMKVGGANETIKNCSDWFLWLKILLVSRVAFVAKPLNYFRFHEGSVIATAFKDFNHQYYREIYDRSMRKIFQDYLEVEIGQSLATSKLIKLNKKYIIEDDGREAVFMIKENKFCLGCFKLLKTSLSGFTISFIRLLWKNN